MKKSINCLWLLFVISLFNQINSLDLVEIYQNKVKDIINSNDIFHPLDNVFELITKLALTADDKGIEKASFIAQLTGFARNYTKKHFAKKENKLNQEKKDLKLEKLFLAGHHEEKEHEREAAKLLIAGANPNLTIEHLEFKNITLLMAIAITREFENLIDLLIKNGADINAKGENNWTALMWAASKNNIDLVRALLKLKKIDINAKNNSGKSALMLAISHGNLEVTHMLLQHKNININAQDDHGLTALMFAVFKEDKDIINMILEQDYIDLNIKDNKEKTARDIALELDYKDAVNLIDKKSRI